MIACVKVIYVLDIKSTNTTNNLPVSITNTIPTNIKTNYEDKKVRYKIDCHILHTVLLVIVLLFVSAITMQNICQNWKTNCLSSNMKMENNGF